MTPRKAKLNTTPERNEATKRRFQIVKLEERIAPKCTAHLNPQGKLVGHYSSRECGYGGR